MNRVALKPLIVIAVIGAIVVGLAIGTFELVRSFGDLAAQKVDLAIKLDRLRQRNIDVAKLQGEQSALAGDTLAADGMFTGEDRATVTAEFADSVAAIVEQSTSSGAEVTRVETLESDGFMELVTAFDHTLSVESLDELINAFRQSRPTLFIDQLELKRVPGTGGESPALNVSAQIRAYADIPTEPDQ